MSKILKRPMFRIGGSANDGIMSMAAPRKNYEDGSEYRQKRDELLPLYQEAYGTGRSETNRLMDLLLESSLALGAGAGAGKKLPQALALSLKEPAQRYIKSSQEEEAGQRQIKLAATTGAISAIDAERLARAKAKGESAFQKNYAPERIYYETYKDLTDPGKKQAFGDSIQQEFPEAFAEFAAYIQPSIRQNSNIGQNFIGTIPSRKEGKDRRFQFDQMVAGGIYFKPDTKKLYQRDPEKNILIELDPYSGKKLRELPLK
jgi:hypothetical protein